MESFSLSGSGTRPSIEVTISGEVPQVTCGAIVAASSVTVRSNFASGSDTSVRQCATARSHSSPCGANGRPFRYSIVVASTAIMPARAPASIAMLHTVIRPSIDSARIALPSNSIA